MRAAIAGSAVLTLLVGCASDRSEAAPTVAAVTTIAAVTTTPTDDDAAPRCTWRAGLGENDGAGGHEMTLLALTNVSDHPCPVPVVLDLVAIGDDAEVLATGTPGGFFPVTPAGPQPVRAGDVVHIELTTITTPENCGATETERATKVRVTFADGGAVVVPLAIEVACGVQYSAVTR